MIVEVTLNNLDYTSDGQFIEYRARDEITEVSPSVVYNTRSSLLAIRYSYLYSPAGNLTCVFSDNSTEEVLIRVERVEP